MLSRWTRRRLLALYRRLHGSYGDQHWWPADSAFEVMVGAVLTQNTAWTNVEQAIAALAGDDLLDPGRMLAVPAAALARRVRPSGYFNVKAQRLRNLCTWVVDGGGVPALARHDTASLRRQLLAINGVGAETADDILLYAFRRPVFVIDAYTRRLLRRLQMARGDETYAALRAAFEDVLPADAGLFGEYHALIVRHAKERCAGRARSCHHCRVERAW